MSNETFFAKALKMKYDQQQQQINSQSQLNRATGSSLLQNAGTNRMNAGTAAFTARSNDAVNRQNADTNLLDVQNTFDVNSRNASTNEFNARTNLLDTNNRFTLGQEQNSIQSRDVYNRFTLGQTQNDINSRAVDNNFKIGQGSNQVNMFDAQTRRLGLARGTARVPGKGDGDKVPAMLEPGEAVLNKKAAGMIGRDKIAKANAKGNQMRAKESASKVAAMLKRFGMV